MSINLNQNKSKINYSQPNFHITEVKNKILNNNEYIDNYNMENKKNFHSFINQKEAKKYNQDKGNINEIEIYITIKKSESNSSKELLKINIDQYIDKQSYLVIQITNPNDPLFLFTLELSEIDYQQIKEEQNLLVDFQKFPEYIFELLSKCKYDNEDKFACVLNISDKGGNNLNLIAPAIFTIIEKTQYKKLIHLLLKMKPTNDLNLKNYLSKLIKEYKNKYETLLKKYEELNFNFDIIQKENDKLKENRRSQELEQKAYIDKVLNEKNKEINDIKEKNLNETKNQLKSLENEKNKIIKNLENEISALQNALNDLKKNKTQLEEHKFKLENNKKDLEGKYAISNTELNVYKVEISNLRYENSELNQKLLSDEKELAQYKFKVESLEKELTEKNNNLESKQQLIETLNKNRDSNEDIIKSLKAKINKLENKLELSANEINKANGIIQTLQNEVKNLKIKLKSIGNDLNSKEELINQRNELLDEKDKTIRKIEKVLENKEGEIINLNNQINDYVNKLKENEKLIEENKEMIVYLNKNIKENNNNPVKARINYSAINFQNNYLENDTFKRDSLEQKNKLLSQSKKQESLYSSKKSNLTESQNSLDSEGKNNEHKYGQSYSPFKQKNISNNTLNEYLNDFIMPVTNFTGYKYTEEKGGFSNTHSSNIRNNTQTERKKNIKHNSMKPVRSNRESVLEYKYGKDSFRNKFSMNNSQK